MGKANNKGPLFVMVMEGFQRTEAWRHTTAVERAIYLEIRRKFSGNNNGAIQLGAREAAQLVNVGKNLAHRALQGLQDKGIIRAGRKGSFDCKSRTGQSTAWILTEEPYLGKPATEDFLNWEPAPEIHFTVPTEGTDGPHRRDRATLLPGKSEE